MSLNQQPSITVIFDGACPLCRREIAFYRRRQGAQNIRWLDARKDHHAIAAFAVTQQQVLSRFHVLDAKGNWHTGAAGFVLLWSQLPAFSLLASAIRTLHLTVVLELGYRLFLRWRKKPTCDAGSCQSNNS